MKTFQELHDEKLILGEGGNICDISIHKLRSPTMKKLHKTSCPVEKDTAMRRAGKKAGMSRAERKKLYNSVEESESRKDALKRALEISKWKRAGGKVDKQPDNIEKWWGQLSPEDQKRAANIAQYKKEKKQKKEEVEVGEARKKKVKLPPHLAKFFDKKGNPKPEVAARMRKARALKGVKITDVTPDWMFEGEVEEGYQEIMNLADLIKSEADQLVKAAKKGDMKTVLNIYKKIGRIIK